MRFSYVKKGSVRHIMSAVGLAPYISDAAKIAAEDCRHCHSYHNHANLSSTDNLKSNLQNNLDTTRSAPIHVPTKLHVIREICECDADSKLAEATSDAQAPSNSLKVTPVSFGKSVNFSKDIDKDVKRVHSSNSESSSSSSATSDSDSYHSNEPGANEKAV